MTADKGNKFNELEASVLVLLEVEHEKAIEKGRRADDFALSINEIDSRVNHGKTMHIRDSLKAKGLIDFKPFHYGEHSYALTKEGFQYLERFKNESPSAYGGLKIEHMSYSQKKNSVNEKLVNVGAGEKNAI